MHLNTMIVRVGALCFVAVAASGYALQSFMAPADPSPTRVAAIDTDQPVVSASLMPERASQSDATLAFGEADTGPAQIAALDTGSATALEMMPDLGALAASVVASVTECTGKLHLAPTADGMIDLHMVTPCETMARAMVEHAGMTFTLKTSATGVAQVMLPAMTVNADVTVMFDSGLTLRESVVVPAAASHDRLVVQWQGNDAFALHVYEFGAKFGDSGHLSRANPTAVGAEVSGRLALLGDPTVLWPMMAEVYTYPANHTWHDGSVRIETEALITADTCARDVFAENLMSTAGVVRSVAEISATLPPCDGNDGFIVLHHDLTQMQSAMN